MVSLSELDNISKATEQQEQQQSTLGQKAAETASAQQEQQYSEDMQSLLDAVQQMREREQVRNRLRTFAAGGGIHIDPSKRGTFTAAASRHGMGVQEFASRVLAHKENYSPAMVKKANFARNASHWHADGGRLITIGDIPSGYVDRYGDMTVTTPSGTRVPLSVAYKDYNQTPVYTNNVPHLTDYLIEQEQPDIAARNEVLKEQNARRARRAQNAVNHGYWNALNIGWMAPTTRFIMNGGLGNTSSNALLGAIETGPFEGFPSTWSEWNTVLNSNPWAFARLHRALMNSNIPNKVASGVNKIGDFIGSLYNNHHSDDDLGHMPGGGEFGGAGGGGDWGIVPQTTQPQRTTMSDIPAVHYLLDNPAETISKHSYGGPINVLAKGGPRRFDNAAQMIEHFEGFRASPYRDGKAYSVGYGQYMYGDGANLDWNALLSGKKKLTREEGHQQVLRSIDKLKSTLRKTLGDELYNSLTPGQLMGYLDTGYQRPASMINAAKVHRQRGAAAAASVLGVNGFADRNAARRAAFTGNWGSDTGGFDYQYTPARYNSNSSLGPILSSTEGGSFAPISVSPAQREFNPWWGAASDEDFMAQQYAAAAGVGTGSMEPQWFALEYNQPKSDAPAWFADGGYIAPIYVI